MCLRLRNKTLRFFVPLKLNNTIFPLYKLTTPQSARRNYYIEFDPTYKTVKITTTHKSFILKWAFVVEWSFKSHCLTAELSNFIEAGGTYQQLKREYLLPALGE